MKPDFKSQALRLLINLLMRLICLLVLFTVLITFTIGCAGLQLQPMGYPLANRIFLSLVSYSENDLLGSTRGV